MEIRQIRGRTWMFQNAVTIPFYRLNEREVVLLDSGFSTKDRQALDDFLRDNHLRVAAILGSHSHQDHAGNFAYFQQRHGAKIILPEVEAALLSSPHMIRMIYPTATLAETRETFSHLLVRADQTFAPQERSVAFGGEAFGLLPLPGHTPGHTGIVTPDDILYVGDTIVSSMKRVICVCLVLLLLAGCGKTETSTPEPDGIPSVTFTDDLGRELTVSQPMRTAAMTGSFADIWCLAGGHDTLAAAAHDTWTSFYLELDSSVTDLGAIKEPSLELLLAAEPDLVLASCNTASNLELLDTLASAGIPTAYFDIQSFNDYLRMLKICTELTGCPENYTRYGTDVQAQVEAATARQDGSAPSVLCLRATGSSCKIKGSRDFLLGEMLADLGCVNVADRDDSLLEDLSLEAVIAADPDYIFAVLQGSDSSRAQAVLEETLLSNPAWSALRAVQEGRFYTLEHQLFNLKPNARWGEAYEILADILYERKDT